MERTTLDYSENKSKGQKQLFGGYGPSPNNDVQASTTGTVRHLPG